MSELKSPLELQRNRRDCKNRVAPKFGQSIVEKLIIAAMVGIVLSMAWEVITNRGSTRNCFYSDTHGNITQCGPLDLLR